MSLKENNIFKKEIVNFQIYFHIFNYYNIYDNIILNYIFIFINIFRYFLLSKIWNK